MREKGSSPIGVGVLTVLTVLLVLILAVFSALTYTSARADLAGPTRIRFQPTMPRTARPRDFSTHSAGTPTRSWRPRFP